MKVRVIVAALALAVLVLAARPRSARAEEAGPFGLGLIIGSPTGISLKYYLGGNGHAIDAAVGGALAGANGISVHADYLWHPSMLTKEQAFDLVWYVGIGVRILDHDRGNDGDDDFHIGPRVPVGLLFDFNEVPLDVFIEVALIVDLRSGNDNNDGHDGIGIDVNAGLGARYYF